MLRSISSEENIEDVPFEDQNIQVDPQKKNFNTESQLNMCSF